MILSHSQTDGQTEVVNCCLETYLRYTAGENPKKWSEFISLAKWWYNTNYHSRANSTPFEILYRYPPPLHLPYILGDSRNESVDSMLKDRETTIKMLKFHLNRAQTRMKQLADRKRSERVFQIEELVWVKLQPYRQHSLCKHKDNKLSPRYYGPHKITDKIGEVAYKLDIPAKSAVHPTFHVSQLKTYVPSLDRPSTRMPKFVEADPLEPLAILDRKLVKRGSVADTMVLIQWEGKPVSEATWEFFSDMSLRFKDSPLWTRVSKGGGDDVGLALILGFNGDGVERGRQDSKAQSEVAVLTKEFAKDSAMNCSVLDWAGPEGPN